MILRIIDKQTQLFIRDDFTLNEVTEIGLDVEPAQGLYQPKWNGTSWEEGMAQEEIDLLKANAIPTEPTIEERVATVETKTVTLEETLEVLFGG